MNNCALSYTTMCFKVRKKGGEECLFTVTEPNYVWFVIRRALRRDMKDGHVLIGAMGCFFHFISQSLRISTENWSQA